MALIWMDNYSHQSSWGGYSTNGSFLDVFQRGRGYDDDSRAFGTDNAATTYVQFDLPSDTVYSGNVLFIGGGFDGDYAGTFGPFGGIVGVEAYSKPWKLIQARYGSSDQIQLAIDDFNYKRLALLIGGTTVAVSTKGMLLSCYNWVEMKVVCHPTNGNIIVKVNEEEYINYTGDTESVAGETIDNIRFLAYYNSWWSDVYICNDSGSYCNNFLGEIDIQTLLPVASGSLNGFDGSDGNSIDNYLQVDDYSILQTGTYVSGVIDGTQETYDFNDLFLKPGVEEVVGVKGSTYPWRDDVNPDISGVHLFYISGVLVSGDQYSLPSTRTIANYRSHIFSNNPVTASAWQVADISGIQYGFGIIE